MMIKRINIVLPWIQEILILWIHSLKWNSGIYLKKEWNSGPSISRFMMDTLCFFHVVLAFLLILTVDRFWTLAESENVFSDVSNLLQWLSDNPNSTPGSLHKMVKWSQNYYWPTFALKAYRWIRKIRHFLPRHKYSLNPYSDEFCPCTAHYTRHRWSCGNFQMCQRNSPCCSRPLSPLRSQPAPWTGFF